MQQILNKQEQTAAAKERLGKHVPAAADTHTRMNGVIYACRAEELRGRHMGQPSQCCTGDSEERT
jgi:hypothetical protein